MLEDMQNRVPDLSACGHAQAGLVDNIKGLLVNIDWPVKELTVAQYVPPSKKWINESYGCYTKPKASLKGVWVGWVNHRKLEPGFYISLPLLRGEQLKTALEDGYSLCSFGPHPLIKRLLSKKELNNLKKKGGLSAASAKLGKLFKQSYPFNMDVHKKNNHRAK